MALNIRNQRAEELAATLARLTSETKSQAVTLALEERLYNVQQRTTKKSKVEELLEIARECDSLPAFDSRDPDEILGYDKNGLRT